MSSFEDDHEMWAPNQVIPRLDEDDPMSSLTYFYINSESENHDIRTSIQLNKFAEDGDDQSNNITVDGTSGEKSKYVAIVYEVKTVSTSPKIYGNTIREVLDKAIEYVDVFECIVENCSRLNSNLAKIPNFHCKVCDDEFEGNIYEHFSGETHIPKVKFGGKV